MPGGGPRVVIVGTVTMPGGVGACDSTRPHDIVKQAAGLPCVMPSTAIGGSAGAGADLAQDLPVLQFGVGPLAPARSWKSARTALAIESASDREDGRGLETGRRD